MLLTHLVKFGYRISPMLSGTWSYYAICAIADSAGYVELENVVGMTVSTMGNHCRPT